MCLYDVAIDGQKKLMTRALAVSIFRACFDTMELVFQTNPDAVQQFMQQASDVWTPFFLEGREDATAADAKRAGDQWNSHRVAGGDCIEDASREGE